MYHKAISKIDKNTRAPLHVQGQTRKWSIPQTFNTQFRIKWLFIFFLISLLFVSSLSPSSSEQPHNPRSKMPLTLLSTWPRLAGLLARLWPWSVKDSWTWVPVTTSYLAWSMREPSAWVCSGTCVLDSWYSRYIFFLLGPYRNIIF